jgi:hypothetical protein
VLEQEDSRGRQLTRRNHSQTRVRASTALPKQKLYTYADVYSDQLDLQDVFYKLSHEREASAPPCMCPASLIYVWRGAGIVKDEQVAEILASSINPCDPETVGCDESIEPESGDCRGRQLTRRYHHKHARASTALPRDKAPTYTDYYHDQMHLHQVFTELSHGREASAPPSVNRYAWRYTSPEDEETLVASTSSAELATQIDRFSSESLSTSSDRIQTAATTRDAALTAYHTDYTLESAHAYDAAQRDLDNACEAGVDSVTLLYRFVADMADETNDPGIVWIAEQFKLADEARIRESSAEAKKVVEMITKEALHGFSMDRNQECQATLNSFMDSLKSIEYGKEGRVVSEMVAEAAEPVL